MNLRLFGLAAIIGAIAVGRNAVADPTTERGAWHYFRSDGGIAGPGTGSLPDQLDTGSSLRWKTPIGAGQSSPTPANGRVFLTTYRPEARELATIALNASNGEVVWQRTISASRIETYHSQTGSAAVATPAWDGTRLLVFFGSHGVICYDSDGRLLWDHAMGPFRDEYGAGSSPVLVGDLVVLCQDHDTDSFLIALDRATGAVRWKIPRPDAVRSYSTPAVWSRGGRMELVVAGALELAGYDPADGRKLWSAHGLARIVIPTPAPYGEVVYMASWAPGGDSGHRLTLDPWPTALAKWDKDHNGRLSRQEIDDREVLDRFTRMDLDANGELEQPEWERHAAVFQKAQNALLAFKPSANGELPASDLLWKYSRGIPYVASPLVDRDRVWLVKDGGIVTKLAAGTGEVLQEERLPGPGAYFASPVTGDGKVYFASEPGVISVVANQRDWKVIASLDLHEKIYATPAFGPGCLYVRTAQALYCFAAPGH